ncbi:hypothetical protein [Kitasatospora sp. NPDC101183]
MRLPSLDAYDMTGIRANEAATWPDEDREAWDELTDADHRTTVEQLLQ